MSGSPETIFERSCEGGRKKGGEGGALNDLRKKTAKGGKKVKIRDAIQGREERVKGRGVVW